MSLRDRAEKLIALENTYNQQSSSSDLPSRKMGRAKCESVWKRLVTRLLVILNTARQQMVVDSFVEAENLLEDKNKVVSPKGKAMVRKPKSEPIDQGIGKPLSRSKAQKSFVKEPEQCNHPRTS